MYMKNTIKRLEKENAKIEAAVKDLQKLKDQEKAELLTSLHGGKINLIPISLYLYKICQLIFDSNK